MNDRARKPSLKMPDVPDVDFVGSLIEIWLGINNAAYHLAYVRVYLQTAALQTRTDELRKLEQSFRDQTQVDVVICRTHLAAFFWQLEHVFEALETAITRGQKEHGEKKYFWQWGEEWKKVEADPTRCEIRDYRNKSHQLPAVIGCSWDGEGKFHHHFLPTIEGHTAKESIDIKDQLQIYFEYVVNTWLSFAPGDYKEKFPRDFAFPVTVPFSFAGELPAGLPAPQLSVQIEAYTRAEGKPGGWQALPLLPLT
jgi:hypothetical protein